MDDLIKQWEEAARHADEVSAKVKTYLDAGRIVPHKLMEEMAIAEDELLLKLLSVQRARQQHPDPGSLH